MVDDIIGKIDDAFRKMTLTRGKVHRFVGMDIEFKYDRKIWITMINYLTEFFDAFEEPIDRRANTPTKHNFFDVFDEEKMSEEKMNLFHHIVAKLLFGSKRARVDIYLVIL